MIAARALALEARSLIEQNSERIIDVMKTAKNGIRAEDAAEALNGCSVEYATAMLANLRAKKIVNIKFGRWYLDAKTTPPNKNNEIVFIPGSKPKSANSINRMTVHFATFREIVRAGIVTDEYQARCNYSISLQRGGRALRVSPDASRVTCEFCKKYIEANNL